MTRINLLPWREARRTQRQRELIAMLAVVALLAVGLVALVYSDVSQRIEFQQERNNYLRGEIARLKKAAEELQALQQTRNRLVERLNVIQKLQTSRPGMVRMLDELVRLAVLQHIRAGADKFFHAVFSAAVFHRFRRNHGKRARYA